MLKSVLEIRANSLEDSSRIPVHRLRLGHELGTVELLVAGGRHDQRLICRRVSPEVGAFDGQRWCDGLDEVMT